MSRESFLLSIASASPGDDGPRIGYADWCEHQGESDRADFIRLQVKLLHSDSEATAHDLRIRLAALARPEFTDDIHPELDAITLQDVRIGSWLASRRVSNAAPESGNLADAESALEMILRRKLESRADCG
jgi:uncharacterized protein (TIGR02996 family)